MANIYDMSDVWNDGGTTFTAIKMDVTDTASASDSLLLDLQVGGSSKFSVDKGGNAIFQTGSVGSPSIIFSGLADTTGIYATSGAINFNFTSVSRLSVSMNGAQVRNTGVYSWSNGSSAEGAADLILAQDAANTLAQRNSTNAQTFNIYNTYTDASNYERGFMKWNSNVLEIGTEALGTGTGRGLSLITGGNTILLGEGSTNNVEFSFPANAVQVDFQASAEFHQTSDCASGTMWLFGSDSNRELIDTDGAQQTLKIESRVNQSGTAAFDGLLVDTLEEDGFGDGSTGDGNNLFRLASLGVTQFKVAVDGVVTADAEGHAVASLPAAPAVGMMARVTDGDSGLTFGNTVVNSGAGATPYLVWYNGTNWTVIGA